MFMPGVWFLWSKKIYYFSKRKGKYFYTFNHFYSENSPKKSKIAKVWILWKVTSERWTSVQLNTFLSIFVITFGWVQQQNPKVMTNMLKKVFNWSEVHLSEVTSYKIHTLAQIYYILWSPTAGINMQSPQSGWD